MSGFSKMYKAVAESTPKVVAVKKGNKNVLNSGSCV